MKKIVSVILAAVVAAVALAGCSSTKGTLYGADQNEKSGLPRWAHQGNVFNTSEAEAYGAIKLSEKGWYSCGMSNPMGSTKVTSQAANLSARSELAGYIAQSIADLQHFENDDESKKAVFQQKTQSSIANVLTGLRIVDGFENAANGDYYSLAFISNKNLESSIEKIDDVQLRAMAAGLIKQWNSEMNVTDGEEPEAVF